MTTTVGASTTATQVATLVFQAYTAATYTDTTATGTISVADGGYVSAPMFSEITATNPTAANIVLTGAIQGKPFTLTSSRTTGSTGAISSDTTTTTVVGPN